MTDEVDTNLEYQVRECFGRVVYSHKTHERMADQLTAKLGRYKIIQIVLTGLASASAVSVLITDEMLTEISTVVLSFLTFFVSTYLKDFDPGSVSQKHRDCAAKLWHVRENYLSLLTDLHTLDRTSAAARRDELQKELASIYTGSPQTNGKAYLEAQDRLKNKEDLTFAQAEIDCFLPENLRRANPDIVDA